MSTHIHGHRHPGHGIKDLFSEVVWSRVLWHILLLLAVLLLIMSGSQQEFRQAPASGSGSSSTENAAPEGDHWTPDELRQHFGKTSNHA